MFATCTGLLAEELDSVFFRVLTMVRSDISVSRALPPPSPSGTLHQICDVVDGGGTCAVQRSSLSRRQALPLTWLNIFSLSVILLWLLVAVRTLLKACTGEIFIAPCLAELRPKSQQDGADRTV